LENPETKYDRDSRELKAWPVHLSTKIKKSMEEELSLNQIIFINGLDIEESEKSGFKCSLRSHAQKTQIQK
jgi:hypothetical protein